MDILQAKYIYDVVLFQKLHTILDISRLFALCCRLRRVGQMKDYVKCLECGYESARTDCYLDIPLTIRPFGATQAYGSVVSTAISRLPSARSTPHRPTTAW